MIRKGEALSFGEWTDSFLKNYSKPPIRSAKTHEANVRCVTHLKAAFSGRRLVELTADTIEQYLRDRLEQRVRIRVKRGYREMGPLKSSTVHQEFRVLRRMLNVCVRKKLLTANPCSGVEFPVTVKGLFRPRYVTWTEQETIETHGPEYLRNFLRIITETGLRIYKELAPMSVSVSERSEPNSWESTCFAITPIHSMPSISCLGFYCFQSIGGSASRSEVTPMALTLLITHGPNTAALLLFLRRGPRPESA